MRGFLLAFSVIVLLSSCKQDASNSTNGKDAEIAKKVEALLVQMTLEEKIGQMYQMNQGQKDSIKVFTAETIRKGGVGSFLNAEDIAMRNELQRIAVEESRLKIPLIFGRDIIHGFRTVFPIPLAQACSWNLDVVREGSTVAAREGRASGYEWTFAPMMDVCRNPRWGRVAEGYGEDPYLASVMAVAMVQGFQGKDMSDSNSIAACAKHYVGYGEGEDGKDYNSTWIPEAKLRNTFLPPFKAAVDAGVATIMSGFNDLNNEPASGNYHTLKEILRDEMQFKGMVVSDWASIAEMISHGYCENEREAAYKAIQGNIDMEMVSKSYIHELDTLLQESKITMSHIDNAVRRILTLKYKVGLFDHPYTDTTRRSVVLSQRHLNIAREAATQSIVMLKNENNVLPLSKDIKKLAVIGPMADDSANQIGTWAFDGRPMDSRTPLAAIKEYLGESRVIYAEGLAFPRSKDKSGISKAVLAARSAEAAVIFVGEESILSGEARCRAFLNLPGAQEELISAVAATGKPIVLVIMAGRPLIFHHSADTVSSVLYAMHGGTMAGPALSDIIFGLASPSGRLPISFPRAEGQIQIYYNHNNTGRPPQLDDEGLPIGTPLDPKGYRSRYLDIPTTPAFPFGFGLSYTTFEYSDIKLNADTIGMKDTLILTATVTNTGNTASYDVPQLYVRDLFGSITRPVKELKAFTKIMLNPGEKKEISFNITPKQLGFYNNQGNFLIEPGKFNIWFASNSADNKHKMFFVLK